MSPTHYHLIILFIISGLSIFFHVYQCFTIYRRYFKLKIEQFPWISYTTPGLTTHSKNRATWLLSLDLRAKWGKSWQTFNVSFPTTACSPTFHKTNVLHNDLKKDAINEFGIKYWTSNPVWVKFQEHGNVNIEEKIWLLVKKMWTKTKTSLFLQKLGDFIETKAKKSPTSPGLVSPATPFKIRRYQKPF
jgi:hypothetical protein